MKIAFFSLATIAVLSVAASAQAPLGPNSIKLGKIAPAVDKTPDYMINGGPQKRSTPQNWLEVEVPFDTTPEEIESLDFNYTVLIDKTLIVGTVTHITIPAGRDHYSVMYIAPRTLLKATGGKPLTAASIGNIWVQVAKQGQTLGETAMKPSPKPNLPTLPGLLQKSETPFAPLFWDRYEATAPKK